MEKKMNHLFSLDMVSPVLYSLSVLFFIWITIK